MCERGKATYTGGRVAATYTVPNPFSACRAHALPIYWQVIFFIGVFCYA